MAKLIKNKCEIEGCSISDSKLLHLHHIIERTEIGTSNKPHNLAILCPTHHAMVHNGDLVIVGPIASTHKPNNRVLIYILNGVKNIDIDLPEYVSVTNKFKIG